MVLAPLVATYRQKYVVGELHVYVPQHVPSVSSPPEDLRWPIKGLPFMTACNYHLRAILLQASRVESLDCRFCSYGEEARGDPAGDFRPSQSFG